MAHLFSILAGRVFERIILSSDPRAAESVMNITAGPSTDIKMASQLLFDQLAQALRDMENYVVEDILQTQTMDWYVTKISRLARRGAMTEKEFYELTEIPFPVATDTNRTARAGR